MQVTVNNITTQVEVQAGYELYEIHVEDYSAESAKNSAIAAALSASNALNSANDAADSAAAALVSENAAAADALATASDRAQTGLDRVATGQDRSATAADAIATAADRVQTGLDRVATAADRVQTGLDRVATAADRVQTGTDANVASTQAGVATTQAGIATTQAGIATTQAGIATTQASNALSSANAAAASASNALNSANAAAASAASAAQVGTSTLLTGFAAGTNTAIAATDSILAAFNKTQGQINARVTSNIYSANGTLAGARVITLGGFPLDFAGTTTNRFFANGNLGINTITDAGFRLDVNGTARVQGALTTNLTATRIPFIGTGGVLTDDAGLVWDNTNKRLNVVKTDTNTAIRLITTENTPNNFGRIEWKNDHLTSYPGVVAAISASIGTFGAEPYLSFFTNTTATSAGSLVERMRITSAGNVGIGVTNPAFLLHLAATGAAEINTRGYSDVAGTAGNIILGKSRGTLASPLAISSGDRLGGVVFSGFNGSSFTNSAAILVFANENFGATVSGSDISFELTTTGQNSRTQRMRIFGSSGNLLIQNGGTFADAGFRLDVNGTARVQGNLTLTAGANIVLQTATGTRIGTATNQLLSFWNKTPIVQPTTAIAAATLAGSGGSSITSGNTFGGYTIQQIAQALINIGILA